MSTRFFRAGVGTVIYNDAGEVAIFKRAQPPVDIWQFQQGGIDIGEAPEVTLWRELKEEVGLTAADVTLVTEVPSWHPYQDLESYENHALKRIGQIHRWYFVRLKPDAVIDLTKATDDEFSDWKFATFEEAIVLANDHKQAIYKMLEKHFVEHIQI